MPQSQFQTSIVNQAAADAIVAKGEKVASVLFINVNADSGMVVVTHGADFDEAAFKAATGI